MSDENDDTCPKCCGAGWINDDGTLPNNDDDPLLQSTLD